ncbi:unnamed protein product [Mytilus edulis]|uniref:C2H2-type domain-containing protein n=1 Tax=Mytilus edulis TaxID=6550 RepID=A0A8S3R7X2_MYTED|nr:unnamed protein product [Mytilus edulis]
MCTNTKNVDIPMWRIGKGKLCNSQHKTRYEVVVRKDKEIEDAAKDWLRLSLDREGGRKQRRFNRSDALTRNERGHLVGYKPANNAFTCKACGEVFNNYSSLFDHTQKAHSSQWGGKISTSSTKSITTSHQSSTQSAIDDAVHVLILFHTDLDRYDLLVFFYNTREEIEIT